MKQLTRREEEQDFSRRSYGTSCACSKLKFVTARESQHRCTTHIASAPALRTPEAALVSRKHFCALPSAGSVFPAIIRNHMNLRRHCCARGEVSRFAMLHLCRPVSAASLRVQELTWRVSCVLAAAIRVRDWRGRSVRNGAQFARASVPVYLSGWLYSASRASPRVSRPSITAGSDTLRCFSNSLRMRASCAPASANAPRVGRTQARWTRAGAQARTSE